MNCFFYFKLIEVIEFVGQPQVRFENITEPLSIPHMVFANEVQTDNDAEDNQVGYTDRSFWLDTKTGVLFGRINCTATFRERFDHRAFPFDRQIIELKMLFKNCYIQKWQLVNPMEYPPDLKMGELDWILQTQINGIADEWDMKKLNACELNNPRNKTGTMKIQIFIQ